MTCHRFHQLRLSRRSIRFELAQCDVKPSHGKSGDRSPHSKEGLVSGCEPPPRLLLSPRLILWLIVAGVLLYGVIYPNLHVVIASLQRDGVWSLANYREALAQRIVLESILASVGVSVLTVLFCAAIGIPLAFLFERYTFPGAPSVRNPRGVAAGSSSARWHSSFHFSLRRVGYPRAVGPVSLSVSDSSPWSLRGWPALLLFHTYTMYPFFYVLTGAGLTRIDAALAEAGRSLGARQRARADANSFAATHAIADRRSAA